MTKTIFIPSLDVRSFWAVCIYRAFVEPHIRTTIYLEETSLSPFLMLLFNKLNITAQKADSSELRHRALNSAHVQTLSDAQKLINDCIHEFPQFSDTAIKYSVMKNLPRFFLCNFFKEMAIAYDAQIFVTNGYRIRHNFKQCSSQQLEVRFLGRANNNFYYSRFDGHLLFVAIKSLFRLLFVRKSRIKKLLSSELAIEVSQSSGVVIRQNGNSSGIIDESLFNRRCESLLKRKPWRLRTRRFVSFKTLVPSQHPLKTFVVAFKQLVLNPKTRFGDLLLRLIIFCEAIFIHRLADEVLLRITPSQSLVFVNNSESYDFVSAALAVLASENTKENIYSLSTSWSCWPHVSIYGRRLNGGAFLGFADKQILSLQHSMSNFLESRSCQDELLKRAQGFSRVSIGDKELSICLVDNVSSTDLYVSKDLLQDTFDAVATLANYYTFSKILIKSKNAHSASLAKEAALISEVPQNLLVFDTRKKSLDSIFDHDVIVTIGSSTPGIIGALLGMPTIDLIEKGMIPYFDDGEVDWYQACQVDQIKSAFDHVSQFLLLDKEDISNETEALVMHLTAQIDRL